MKFGAHVSIAGGIEKSPSRARELGCECFQVFTRPPQGGSPSRLDQTTVDTFFDECSRYRFFDYYIHTPYFINLASENEETCRASVSIIKEELVRGSIIEARYVVTHIGSGKESGKSRAIMKVTDGLKRVLDGRYNKTKLLLENSAGQGSIIGDTFEELAEILEKVGNPDLGICLDTAHLFASGYDIRTEETFTATLRQFSSIVGLDKLKLLHGNDSKVGLGDRKDRHEHIGKGRIGIDGFATIVNHPHLKDIDLIIETPLEKVGDDIMNLKKLRSMKKK